MPQVVFIRDFNMIDYTMKRHSEQVFCIFQTLFLHIPEPFLADRCDTKATMSGCRQQAVARPRPMNAE